MCKPWKKNGCSRPSSQVSRLTHGKTRRPLEKDPTFEEPPGRESHLTPERIEELLKRGAKGAAELDRQLRQVFRMPDRNLILD
jgi:hypothetical protein